MFFKTLQTKETKSAKQRRVISGLRAKQRRGISGLRAKQQTTTTETTTAVASVIATVTQPAQQLTTAMAATE